MWNWLKPSPAPQDQPVPQPNPPEMPVQSLRPQVIIITGTSGSGRKGCALKLCQELGLPYVRPYTTRAIRPKEKDGEHYHFVTDAVFREMQAAGAFFQTVRLGRGSYGIAAAELDAALAGGQPAVAVVNRDGAEAFRQRFGSGAIRVFLYVTKDDIRLRLERESAPPEVVDEYLRNYPDDVIYKKESEFLLQNMDPAATVGKIKDFLRDKLAPEK
ncbi:guanylate kinase [Gorillibacterium sp. sgz5001074]|uniref:guanylate kinase n=1 Tax=Gorillibacterium sp. sgz5001074 TaxID=3446695 RepID=UPI003F67A079